MENGERQRDQDLKDLMRQEEARGRRLVDPDAEREQRELVQGFGDLAMEAGVSDRIWSLEEIANLHS